MTAIFISYRREDSQGEAGRLYDHLLQYFDEREIFLDIKSIKPGEDFTKAIEKGGICDALIAVIGPKWLDIPDEKGYRRIDNPKDFVRFEIASALTRNILVIPVLVARARMPRANELPSVLADLSKRNAIELSHDRFEYDVARIAHAIGGSYGKILLKVGFQGSGMIAIYDNQAMIGKIKEFQKPLTIQLENGVHNLYASLQVFQNQTNQDILHIWGPERKTNKLGSLIKSDVLPVHIKVGQIQQITIEREMIFPAQYETRKEPSLVAPDHLFEKKVLISPPKYKLLMRLY